MFLSCVIFSQINESSLWKHVLNNDLIKMQNEHVVSWTVEKLQCQLGFFYCKYLKIELLVFDVPFDEMELILGTARFCAQIMPFVGSILWLTTDSDLYYSTLKFFRERIASCTFLIILGIHTHSLCGPDWVAVPSPSFSQSLLIGVVRGWVGG